MEQRSVTTAQVEQIVNRAIESLRVAGQRVLLIVPDGTRTAPVGLMFRLIHAAVTARGGSVDVMFALGTHPPMSEQSMLERLELSADSRAVDYGGVRFLNHAWDDPGSLVSLGVLSASQVENLSEGRFSVDVPVTVNRAAIDYDRLIIVGPVFPHEVAGFSGGSKYLFPGISGPELLNFFHWLGALITSPRIIGQKWTPVRRVIEAAASMVPTACHAFCLVVGGSELLDVFFGVPVEAWSLAADASALEHIVHKDRAFGTVLACAPQMYRDLWVGGKCMYKLESVVADGGELIIYAPHIREISPTHGVLIEKMGYHVRDYFLARWEEFKDVPWGVLAHSTHVRGFGTYEERVERPRITVTLATGISRKLCEQICLGYRDPASIDVEAFEGRESEGVLAVRNAGETLYRLG